MTERICCPLVMDMMIPQNPMTEKSWSQELFFQALMARRIATAVIIQAPSPWRNCCSELVFIDVILLHVLHNLLEWYEPLL